MKRSKNRSAYSRLCSLPWTTLFVDHTGDIFFCCYRPAIANINNISENAIDEIWNGKEAQDLRRRWNEGNLEGTPCSKCIGLRRFKKYDHIAKDVVNSSNGVNDHFFSNAQLNIYEFNEGKTILKSMPVDITYVPSCLCNIHCIHCFQPPITKSNFSYPKIDDFLKFYNYLGKKAIINRFSGGESLLLRQTWQLIDEFSSDHKAASEIFFYTNGLLIKDKYKLIAGFRKYSFMISIAAFEKKRYEYIHGGASFEKLIENLEFLAGCKCAGSNITTTIHMILMKSNFIDLERLFEFAEAYKFDNIWITPIHEAFDGILFNEDIFQFPHLLEKVPSWQDILEKASKKAKIIGYDLAYYHLEYIKGQLSSSIVTNRYRSICNLFFWELKRVLRWPPLFLVKKLLKLALKKISV